MDPVRETLRNPPRGRELLSLLSALLVVALIAIFSYQAWVAFRRQNEQAVVTKQIADGTNALLSSLKDAETGQRGFLLTGTEGYLDPYREALISVPATLGDLIRLAAISGSGQPQRIETLATVVRDKFDELRGTIDLRRNNKSDAAVAVVLTGRGKELMDQIRGRCAEIQAIANDRLADYSQEARSSVNRLGLIGTFGSAGLLLLLLFSAVTIQRGTLRRQHLIQKLQTSETKTREARDWLQTTLRSIGDAVIATDAAGKVTFLNSVAESLTGWPSEAATGVPLEEIFVITNEATGATVENPVTKALREGRVVGLANHTVLTAKDGGQTHIDDSAAPIRAEDGSILGVVLVFRDVTGRKEAERAIEKSVERLQQANENLNHFAFAASHDLQEPLRMITSYSQLLLKGYRGELDGEAAICVQFISEGTKRMRELLADLLSYTQLTVDEELPPVRVDLNRVLQMATANLQAMIDESRAVITSEQLPTVRGQEAHFLQLFQNLMANAIKYSGDGPPRIGISVTAFDGVASVAVADNGIGIDPEYHQRIFGVFKRLHGKKIPGTGMGLAICQRVVERYGGRIWVSSEVNRGATFYFTLPPTQGERV